ncbi:MAG: ribose-phosphate pyrophosphokinase [Saprospiraceae bacterium]|jgi:ribose-phosphate pyrophosphokinase|nr:ribose-phosphate pyrophosphokinase [Saprospiraceae bacterium]MBK7435884.1 ribose-phosphate pyrophosphokinase [Saprospiraceae bacterium]MBK7606533.1 ribose-phosphate pyrophosphokinase [Saprospiraceae bacterium]MBK8281691.1 ribose-phosphate pyrophosphokinase [Saprospiraceae bacterium]MBK8514017.1 ribose-phosphate pyrophosphokinase [Saprospiraceae bacterium]
MVVKVFSGTGSRYLSEKIMEAYGQPLGDMSLQRFSDGEMHPIINESVRGAFVFFIQSTGAPVDNLFETLLFIDTARRASADYITAVIPYFGFARQDRKDKSRVPITAKLIANLLSTAGANRVMTMDLHADQIQGFFDIPVDHLRSEAIFKPFLKKLVNENTVFACADVGGVKRARNYAKYFNTELVICDKSRSKPNEIGSMMVIGEVEDKQVILVDDIVDTAGTLCAAAEALKTKGASSVIVICTHPVLSGSAYEKIEASFISQLYVTDTLPLKKHIDKIKVLSSAELFSKAILTVHEHRSIAALYVD